MLDFIYKLAIVDSVTSGIRFWNNGEDAIVDQTIEFFGTRSGKCLVIRALKNRYFPRFRRKKICTGFVYGRLMTNMSACFYVIIKEQLDDGALEF